MQRTQCRSHEPFTGTEFGKEICADTIVANATKNWGLDGEEHGVVVYDRGSKWIGGHPTATKTEDDATQALQHFIGPGRKVDRFYSDQAPELIAAAHALKLCNDTATPGRPDTNGVAESAVRRVVEGTKAVLFQAGMEPEWWTYAMPHWCFSANIEVVERQSAWNTRFKEGHWKGGLFPFGSNPFQTHAFGVQAAAQV